MRLRIAAPGSPHKHRPVNNPSRCAGAATCLEVFLNILGLATIRDSAAALVQDGKITAAVEEERFTRRKKQCGFPRESIKYCLHAGGLSLDDVDCVAVYWKPWMLGRVVHVARYLFESPNLFRAKARRGIDTLGDYRLLFRLRQAIDQNFGGSSKSDYRLRYLDHHLTHAASTFLVSPFDEAAILTADGSGETTTTLLARGEGTSIKPLERIHLPHSLGHLYAAVTRFLGFRKNRDEGKVMGLASYGDPGRYHDIFKKIVSLTPGGGFKIDVSYFDQHLSRHRQWSQKSLEHFGTSRTPDMPLEQRHSDIAAGLQNILEEAMLHVVGHLYEATRSKNLCLAGGVALNCAMNGRVISESRFENVFIQPAAHDAGGALGGALLVHCSRKGARREHEMRHAYLGPAYSDGDYASALDGSGCDYRKCANIAAECARLLAQGKIIGWFQGAMEFGPRALGSRSIIADPRDPAMKDTLNEKVKFREGFRPFAPSVLEEHSGDYFEQTRPSPFMLLVSDVRPDKRALIPSVTHVDGTARLHTVDGDTNKPYRKLIEEFYRITGVPMILNTSLNVKGEPIINTPEEAVRCFNKTGMDYLVLGDFLVAKQPSRASEKPAAVRAGLEDGPD